MPTNLKPDFKPDANSYANLSKHGAIPEFVDSQLDFFITYWTEKAKTGCKSAKKESWQMTLQTWMRRAWNGRVGREWEKSRHYQTRAPSKGDPFESALAGIQMDIVEPIPFDKLNRDMKKIPEIVPMEKLSRDEFDKKYAYKNESISAESAFDQLRQMGYLK